MRVQGRDSTDVVWIWTVVSSHLIYFAVLVADGLQCPTSMLSYHQIAVCRFNYQLMATALVKTSRICVNSWTMIA